jgi:hypothetical protein
MHEALLIPSRESNPAKSMVRTLRSGGRDFTMSDFLVAYFHTQLEAVISAKKLLAFGLERDKVTIHVPGKPAMGLEGVHSTTSSDHKSGQQDIAATSTILPAEESPEPPPLRGCTTLAVALKDRISINDVCSVLKDAGAYLIDVTEKNLAQEYPDM